MILAMGRAINPFVPTLFHLCSYIADGDLLFHSVGSWDFLLYSSSDMICRIIGGDASMYALLCIRFT